MILLAYPLHAQEFQWGVAGGGNSGNGAQQLEKVSNGVVFRTSQTLEKRDKTGQQVWKFDFFDLDGYQYRPKPSLGAITVDEDDNVYAQLTFPVNGPGPTTIANIDIPHGESLIKINRDGELLWSRKLTGSKNSFLKYHNGIIYTLGVFDTEINIADTYIFENTENTDCSLNSSENTYARDIYIAKFNTIGQVKGAIKYGGTAHDDLKSVTVDNQGNLFLAINYGFESCTTDETQIHKINSDLSTLWAKTISRQYEEGNGYHVLLPSNIHMGPNGKLYLWSYAHNTVVSDDFRFIKTGTYGYTAGLLEYNAQNGTFLNYKAFDGLSSKVFGGYMANYREHLLIATSFTDTQEFDNGSLSAVNLGTEAVLLEVDLNNLSIDYLLQLTGSTKQYVTEVEDWSGPIQLGDDALYYSGTFGSDTLNISPQSALYNTKANQYKDYFLIKYQLDELVLDSTVEDFDQDGVANSIDLCPNTLEGATVDEQGCSLAQKDSDLDEVTDDLDQCADTASGVAVDIDGCSLEQIDSDGDGVPDLRDTCADTTAGATVDEDGCEIAILDSDLFQIEAISEACKDASNGRIRIQTDDTSKVYRAVLNGTQEVSFTGETQFSDLAPGQYELCILADEVVSDMHCYSLSIEKATDLDLDGQVDLSARILKLELSGSRNYKVDFNGNQFETQESFLELKLQPGKNKVLVTTHHLCQDSVSYTVDLGLQVAPNPFTDAIDLSHIQGNGLVTVTIHSQQGLEVYHRIFGPYEPVILKNLTSLSSGIYLLSYSEGQQQFSQKIIRK